MPADLDDVDRGILHLLQRDARNTTAQEIAQRTGVAPSTVRNRIDRLEAAGVITGYRPTIDYEAAGYPLQVLFVVTAPPTERATFVDELLEVDGVVDVRETLTGQGNIYVEVIGTSKSDVMRMTDAIHDMGLQIDSSDIVKRRTVQPFDHFHTGSELVGDDADDPAG